MGKRNRKEKGQADLTSDLETDVNCSLSVLALDLPAAETILESMLTVFRHQVFDIDKIGASCHTGKLSKNSFN